jgi:hypothetical protein
MGLDKEEATETLGPLELDEVWGIGSRHYANKLKDRGILTINVCIERGYTNLDGYIHHECMRKTKPHIIQLLEARHALRSIGNGTVKVDLSNQQELFSQEDPQQR